MLGKPLRRAKGATAANDTPIARPPSGAKPDRLTLWFETLSNDDVVADAERAAKMALVDDAPADESFTVDDTHATLKTSDVDLELARVQMGGPRPHAPPRRPQL